MVYALQIAVRNIRNRAVQSLLTLIVVALAVALTITILVLADGLQQGILTASRGFGVLLIGPKGSPQQLALSTILLQGAPIGLMNQSAYQDILAKNPAIKIAPLAMSDNIGGASIIGTDQSFFLLQRDNNDPLFQIAAGRLFAGDFEVVLGSQTATESALKIGDRFHPSHGIGKGLTSDVHTNITYTVVGILKPSHSPYDRAAFATINSIWVTHDTANETSDPNAQTSDASDAGKVAPSHGKLTAALLLPFGIQLNTIYTIAQGLNNGKDAMAVYPGAELGNLFDLLNQGQVALNIVALLALFMASITTLLSLYATTLSREQAIAVMRSLGASRSTVFMITLLEAIGLTVLGVLLGAVIGHAVAAAVGDQLAAQSALPIETRILWSQELPLLLIPVVLGVVAGLLPAVMAYRLNVVEKLFAT